MGRFTRDRVKDSFQMGKVLWRIFFWVDHVESHLFSYSRIAVAEIFYKSLGDTKLYIRYEESYGYWS